MYGFTLIATLVLLGGVIAFVGDRIGMRVGRRRLTLFGLRPRHTSVLITIMTGLVIVASSLLVLSVASNDVRTALFRVREIQEELGKSREQLQAVEDQLSASEARLDRVVRERNQAEALRDQALAQRQQAVQELEQAKTALGEIQQQLASARGELESTRTELTKADQDLQHYKSRVEDLKQVSERLTSRVAELQGEVDDLRGQQARLAEGIQLLAALNQRLQYDNLAIQANEILLARVMGGKSSKDQLEAALFAFLRDVDQEARRRGAAQPMDKNIEVSPANFDEVLNRIASGGGSWVVRARALANTPPGQPIRVVLQAVARTLAFEKGQVISERVIDGSLSSRVEDQMLELLRTVNETAIEQGGMITQEDGTVGKLVSAEEFVSTVAAIRRSGERVKVMAVAVQDTWNTEGPLSIELRVEPVSRASSAVGPQHPATG